ncbi:hypothetical protein NHX12_002374 [Muraenolepis orangiensis]|uniref:Secreted protein n=1 Tax=Muraenolepis orangiensis TaxID=630683 RepID=A0A9Q0DW28_9TELE|nr:hypothetical protein NHX12_002374 [Muraenolepis orangiensis]
MVTLALAGTSFLLANKLAFRHLPVCTDDGDCRRQIAPVLCTREGREKRRGAPPLPTRPVEICGPDVMDVALRSVVQM